MSYCNECRNTGPATGVDGDFFCSRCGSNDIAALPVIGTRVELVREVDRYPHALIERGERGTVTLAEVGAEEGADTFIAVTLDHEHAGLAEWDNAIIWSVSMENLEAYALDVRPA